MNAYLALRQFLGDPRYRTMTKAVISLIGNVIFACYNAALGLQTGAVLFVVSAVYYLLLSTMRFSAWLLNRSKKEKSEQRSAAIIGSLLVILSAIFPVLVFFSMHQHRATAYGTIPMITIATYTFTKITTAGITAYKHRRHPSRLILAINAIRYAEVAVSLMTMQQSMLVSFGDGDIPSATILNACTGAGVCLFILALGVATISNSRKEQNYERSKNRRRSSRHLPEG